MSNTNKRKKTTLQIKKAAIKKKHAGVNWKRQTQKIVGFLNKNGYVVEFKDVKGYSTIDYEEKLVTIHSGHNEEIRFYTIVHELGHAILFANPSKYSQNTGYVYNNFTEKSVTWKVTELNEEFEAWHAGYKQAKRMKLKINRINFEKYKAEAIMSYVDWVYLKSNRGRDQKS